MKQIERTTNVLIGDDVIINVTELPQNLQEVIDIIDDWRQREIEAQNELWLVQSGLAHLQAVLSSQIQEFLANRPPATVPEGDQ